MERHLSFSIRFFIVGFVLSLLAASAGCRGSGGIPVGDQSRAPDRSKWKLGRFERLKGSDYLMAPLYSGEKTGEYSFSDGSPDIVRNYMFVNSADKSSRWLIASGDYLILEQKKLPLIDERDRADQPAAKWIYYELVNRDTDQDKFLTYKDRRIIAVSDATGASFVELITDIDSVLGLTMRDENTLVVIYSASSKNLISEINLSERKIAATSELAEIALKP